MSDTREKLSTGTVALHWVIGLGMIGMVVMGLILEDMPRGDFKSSMIQLHKSIGVVVLALAAWRVAWRLREGMPDHVGRYTAVELRLGQIIHGALLLSTLLLPVSGMLLSIGNARPINLFGMPFIPQLLTEKNALLYNIGHVSHAVLGKLLIAVIVLHVAGALKHHVVDRDGTLRRMLGARVDPEATRSA